MENKRLVLGIDGRYQKMERGLRGAGGTYVVDGDLVRFTDRKTSPSSCASTQDPGVYRWELDNDSLTLTAVDDPCLDRRSFLERRWSKY